MISAMDFCKDMHPSDNARPVFGIDKDRTAKVLRELADAIESSKVFVQGGRVIGIASPDDFGITTLRLKFAETRIPAEPVKKELYGNSHFPVAVAVANR